MELRGDGGDGGGEPPPIKRAKTESGNEYHIGPGGKPEIARPIISVDELPDGGAAVSIQVANEDQLDWAIHQLKERFPDKTIDEEKLRAAAKKSQSYLDEAVGLKLSIGGPNFFRGLCKAAFNLIGVTDTSLALQPELDKARYFILRDEGNSQDFVSWVLNDEPLKLPTLGESDHSVGVFGKGGEVGGFVQLYGQLPFILRFCSGCDCDDFSALYVVNPFRDTEPAESRELTFDPSDTPSFDSCAHLPGKGVWPHYVSRIERILSIYQERADKAVISDIVHNVFDHKEGEIITEEDVNQFSQKAAEFIGHKLTKPGKPNKALDANSPPDEESEPEGKSDE